MDLSKIPEPSEDDLNYAKLLMEIVDYEKLTHHDKAHSRIIAHLLRHGSVLAEKILDEFPGLVQDVPLNDPAWGKVMKAISFFEQFGGEA